MSTTRRPPPRVGLGLHGLQSFDLIWLFFIFSSLQPLIQKNLLAQARRRILANIARQRQATVITLIHRQETISLHGIPLVRHIDIDDAESVLRAIRETPPGKTIEIIPHSPGGLVLAASQIARALHDHDGRVIAVVPHYAMSGGTLIALAADEIQIDRHAALGPVDPQLGQYPARSLVDVAAMPGDHEDQTRLLADVGRKALRQVRLTAQMLLEKHMDSERATEVAELLATGVWTHDHPLMAPELEQLGFPVQVGVPEEERSLMDLYPQPRGREASVEYASGPRVPPVLPRGRDNPRRADARPAHLPARTAPRHAGDSCCSRLCDDDSPGKTFPSEVSTMEDDHRIKPVLDKLSHARGTEANSKPKGEKGRAHEFPHHQHSAVTHTHGHSHVIHYREPGQRDEWSHLTTTHEHEHDHPRLVHMHIPHEELQLEHVHEAHRHDHEDSPGH